MNIEKLKELKLAVGVVFQHWLDTAANQKGFDNTVSKKFFKKDAELIQEILDEAIASQSVKSEEIQEAIVILTEWRDFLSGKLPVYDLVGAEAKREIMSYNLAITALKAYQQC